MKLINFPKGYILSAFNGPTLEMTADLMLQIMTPIETNKARILDAAIEIERTIERIISHHFFGYEEERQAKADEFTNQILNSDWCTFSSKRKLLSHIININTYLEGKEKSNYEALLKKTMSHRNAFAHGELSTDGREVRLKFFESNLRIITLTDDYFDKVEKELNECWEISRQVGLNSGAFRIIGGENAG
ncbi:MAG: hypothetical protein V4643_03285 [Bacteroidota bacterium]